MKKLAFIVLIALAGMLLGGPALAQIENFETRRDEGRALLLTGLIEYSDWCRKEKLFAVRESVMLRILELDPEHAESLKALGYRQRDGAWSPPKRKRKFKDFSKASLKEVPDQEAAAIAPSMAHLKGLLKHAKVTTAQHMLLLKDLIVIDPDNAKLRAERGEVKSGDQWILEETARAVEFKAQMAQALGNGLNARTEASELRPRESGVALPWTGALTVPVGRIAGTVNQAELKNVASRLQGALELLQQIFGEALHGPEDLNVVLFSTSEEGKAFLAECPELTDEARAGLEGLAGVWLGETDEIAYWTDKEDQRLDGVIRLFVKHVLEQGYFVTMKEPWIHEGFGLFLTEAVTGTRHTWFAGASDPEGAAIRTRLIASNEWVEVAREIFAETEGPVLKPTLLRPSETFTAMDLLVSYTFSVYLIESHAEQLPRILGKLCAGLPPDKVFKKELGRNIEELDARLRTWLEEMHAVEEGSLQVEAGLLR